MNLKSHCGSAYLDRTQLRALTLPEPKGPRHVVRPFIDDVDLLQQCLEIEGLVIQSEAFMVLPSKSEPAKFWAVMQVQDRFDYALVIGLRGSYDRSITRSIAVGSHMIEEGTLAFSHEITLATKQTLNINRRLPTMFAEAVSQVQTLADHQDERFDAYKKRVLSGVHGDSALVNLVREGAILPSSMGRLIELWDESEHTVYGMHKAATEVMLPIADKPTLPMIWERTQLLTRFLDGVILEDIRGNDKSKKAA